MARINIDDDVESQLEYRRLLKLLNYDDDKALGMLVRFWRLAQKYWGQHKLVPLEEIENWEFQPIIESRWGIIQEGGVYAVGSEERFAWYRQACDAGKKGGRPRKSDDNPTVPPRNPTVNFDNPMVPSENPTVNFDNPTVLSENLLVPVPAPVPVLENKKKNLKAAIAPNGDIGKFIGTYVKAYQKRFPPKEGLPPPRPDLRGKAQGQIKKYLAEVPIDRACDLIQAYCQMEDRWFETKCYDFGTFLENQNKISLALDTGENPAESKNSIDWSKVWGKNEAASLSATD